MILNNSKTIRDIPGCAINDAKVPEIPTIMKSEGKIEFMVADGDSIYDAPAFFNPVMVLNRDLALLFTRIYSETFGYKVRAIEPLAGIGIRAFRMLTEAEDYVEEVVINDYNDITIQISNFNIEKLQIQDRIHSFKREAKSLMLDLAENGLKFHYLDLDPFGPPTPFIDSIWSVLALRSMVAVTATDMTALCGVYPKACLRKYGSIPLNNHHTHETAARILIATVVRSAARLERGVRPVFTASVDHYTKVFYIVNKSAGAITEAVSQIGFSYTCKSCFQIYYEAGIIAKSKTCCSEVITDIAGPLWVGDLFDKEWCGNGLIIIDDYLDKVKEAKIKGEDRPYLYPSFKRMKKLLDEGVQGYDLHGYYCMDVISRQYRIAQPRIDKLAEKLNEDGYRFVKSNFVKQAFRTDASGTHVIKSIKSLVLEDE
jgi:tRNA (guanine26-N2/guanine27-N2)-dimethyltransferase